MPSVPLEDTAALGSGFGVAVGLGGVGAATALTMTWKLPLAVWPTASVAVQVTVVLPTGKLEPEAGRQATVALPPCSSVPAGGLKVTTRGPAGLTAADTLAWDAIVGDWAS